MEMVRPAILLAFLISVGLHVSFFFAGGGVFVKSVQFAVDPGVGGVEVQLRSETSKKNLEVAKPLLEPVTKSAPKEKSMDKGKDEETVSSVGGALMQSQPGYLTNPAPIYPAEARRLGQEGIVILSVDVDRSGTIAHIEIKQSTGHLSLDNAAIKALRRWKFAPARIGQFTIDSKVEVPIRFRLEKN